MAKTKHLARKTAPYTPRLPPPSLDDARQELRAYCSGLEADLQDALASVAQLGQLCAQAPAAHGALDHQVQAMDDFLAAGAPAAGSETPSWIDVLEDKVGTVQRKEQEMKEVAAGLVEKLGGWAGRTDAARAAACRLRGHTRVQLNRQHNKQQPPLLLRLPDVALEAIARKMGKRARLLCSELRLAYGSPGAVLAPPYENCCSAHGHALAPAQASALQSWRHPVRRLDLSRCSLGSTAARDITEALPGLQELHVSGLNPIYTRQCPVLPHPSLTSLHAWQAPYDLRCVAAFAPRLRSLHLGSCHQGASTIATPSMVWDALAALPGLQSLRLPLSRPYLTPSTAFCATLQRLTALTHLGLALAPDAHDANTLPDDDTRGATRALAALPRLASVYLSNFRMLGPTLGPALQALPQLRILALDQQRKVGLASEPDLPAGCLPALSAMRRLEELSLTGGAAAGSAELGRASGGGGAPLEAVALEVFDRAHVPALCELLEALTALTSLSLGLCSGAGAQQRGRLASAVAQLALLQRLRVHSVRSELVPSAAALPALTCLEMHVTRAGLWSNLHAVEGLSSLKRLVLCSELTSAANRKQCMFAVRKLPLLEDVEVGCSEWTGEDLRLLLPPPEQLRRLVLLAMPAPPAGSGQHSGAAPARGVAAAVEQLGSYGVHVTLRRG